MLAWSCLGTRLARPPIGRHGLCASLRGVSSRGSNVPRLQARGHADFVCRLRERWPQREMLANRVAQRLAQLGYAVVDTPLEVAERTLATPHLSSSSMLSDAELRGA